MSITILTARSPEQRMAALRLANQARMYHAGVKRALRAGELGFFDALDDERCATMKVRDVLLSMPKFGEGRTDRALHRATVAHSKTCAGITWAQRERLVDAMRYVVPHAEIVWRS